ncbi:MAG TPA: SGNH family hydrolase [Beijerinckiaceae bacterium]|jgi:hypothetical protein
MTWHLSLRHHGVWASLALALVLLGFHAPAARAENEDGLRYPGVYRPYTPPPQPRQRYRRPDPYAQPAPVYPGNSYYYARPQPQYAPPQQYYYQRPPTAYYPGMPVYPERRRAVVPREAYPPPPPGYVYVPNPNYDPGAREARRQEQIERRRKARRVVPAAPVVRERPEKPKAEPEVAEIEPSTTILVLGDTLADSVGQGLDDAFEEANDVEVVRKVRGDSGLARLDLYDWPKVAQETLTSGQKTAFAVIMLGANDRQAIREGETTHDPLSDRWRQLYRERVDAVLKPFLDRKVPVIWVGAPPMRNEGLNADVAAINEISRERVQRVGGTYVDIWPGFVNDENKYAATGPDLEGQVTRLRASDGMGFTRAGARKAAHFAETELKRLIEQKNAGTAVAALPNAAAPAVPGQPTNVDQIINSSVPALPELPGLPSLAARPLAGPVLPLTKPDVSPGGALVTARPKLDADTSLIVDRALRDGLPPAPKPGRADDFKWPRS